MNSNPLYDAVIVPRNTGDIYCELWYDITADERNRLNIEMTRGYIVNGTLIVWDKDVTHSQVLKQLNSKILNKKVLSLSFEPETVNDAACIYVATYQNGKLGKATMEDLDRIRKNKSIKQFFAGYELRLA